MKPILTVDSVSKRFLVGHQTQRESYTALRDVLGQHVKNFVRKSADMIAGRQIVQGDEIEEFWALKDVSFEVHPGEVVGIIGRNGAGKSTLLRVLSRITEPSQGRAVLRGRVASLLEVGTGFHPELTGRENVFLNGAILGMARAEIKRKFDEIVQFAEVERFLDTPVKRYSSGMYVRLAFAVAAHLEPEILIVDEVLAVGDADFQKKCIAKMKDVGDSGRTVLLVSHNMGSIASLCTRAILLQGGQVVGDGDPSSVILEHLTSGTNKTQNRKLVGDENGELLDVWAEDPHGVRSNSFSLESKINVVMEYRVLRDLPVAPFPNFHFHDQQGQCVFVVANRLDQANKRGTYKAICEIPGNLLNDGAYFITAALTCSHNGIEVCFVERDAVTINLVERLADDIHGPPRFGYAGPYPGALRPKFEFTIEPIELPTKSGIAAC